ncbi:hypothetical protein [uncultured Clostridium sp.]|uniref:hypothetical protein n=1 Tax=uncultured Clostridium sp. TaxID=59620 RepID=UPI0026287FB8|nr:hypothetical protein [uncultured Clostridium sp.]
MGILKICILIFASVLTGMFIAGILITLAFKNSRIKTYRSKGLKPIILAKFDVIDETAYLLNDKNFWNGIELTFYFMFGRFFYKSPLIWRKEKRTKIYLSISITLLLLLFIFAIF